MKMLNKDQSISNKNNNKEESVEELLAKLAKRGKKVKLLDESASVKELPKQEDNDEDLDRAEGDEFDDN
jgi:fructoselysine-6-P-deglycase FrlB-like protein